MNIPLNMATKNKNGIDEIYVPFIDEDKSNDLHIITWDNLEIVSLQFIENEINRFGRFKVYFGNGGHDYFRIGCKGSGLKIDNVKYMADEAGMLDIKQINTHLHNRKISEVLERL